MIDTRVPAIIRVTGSLDEDPSSKSGMVVAGRIDPASLRFLRVDEEYQRPLADRPDIYEAITQGVLVPPIDLGVRGAHFDEVEKDKVWEIRDPTYIIDGWQRVGTALRVVANDPDFVPRIFGTFHFGTDQNWEMHRFSQLNKNTRKVSPALHLKNMREKNEAVLTLYGLSNSTKDFPLFKRVQWGQNRHSTDLIPALQLAYVAWRLHAHHSAARGRGVDTIAESLLVAARAVGLQQFRENVVTFWEVLDSCWSIRTIQYWRIAPHIKSTFTSSLAKMLSDHTDFWQGNRLHVDADNRRKIGSFALDDPTVAAFAGSGGTAGLHLYTLLVQHMNKSRRTGRLRSRYEK